MRLLLGHDELVAEWIRRRIPHMANTDGFGQCVTMGVIGGDDGATMLGAVVFHNYLPVNRSIHWSAAAVTPNWLNRRIITDILRYPFKQLDCVRITAVIPRRNRRSRDFQERFGFKHEGTMRREFVGDDACVYGLLRSEWNKSRFNLDRPQQGIAAEPASVGIH